MDHLRRELAPISDTAWEQIELEATRTLRHFLAGRPLVDFTGPLGWEHAAHPLGRVGALSAPAAVGGDVATNLALNRRATQPLMEIRADFEIGYDELDAIDRGVSNPDLSSVVEAARRAAYIEDHATFHGFNDADIIGIAPASTHESLPISDDYDEYPGIVASAAARLRASGVGGPYATALGPRCYTGVIETTEHGGYPVLEHIKLILGGPVVWAPAVDGAVVVSQRGGDYELVCGQDFSIGYAGDGDASVKLYIEESMTFVVRDERAAVHLVYPT
jgi:uncharacterized linocin/CFP29 family protein